MNHRSANLFLLLISFAIFISNNVFAKEIRVVKPEKEGVSQERLNRITNHMNQAVKDGTMIGGMGLIARNGKIIYSETYGLSDREANKPMTEDAIYPYGQITHRVDVSRHCDGLGHLVVRSIWCELGL